MYSRAYILLKREFEELKNNNYEGITALPISEDMMQWDVDIEGLQNTIWHGAFFQLRINFTSEYNFVPPVVKFRTIPFHPNVDPHSGKPCIDFLDSPRKWNRSYTLSSILLTLQVMLSNPVLENPVNLEAAHILMKDETLYRLIILRLFHQPLPFLKDLNFIKQYYNWKKDDLRHTKEWSLRYIAAISRIARENINIQKVNYQTRRSYICVPPIQTSPDSQTETDTVTKKDQKKEWWKRKSVEVSINEPWENEVDDLVAWTNSLDTDALED
ncbi:ubiquitin-conjugating enzyme E2 U isoform X2 [Odocoileus virginianus]|uniref:Ubiquitin-conjugating enzyme E2 U isoform X2 n=1 Tax=Odocoileus virginianus TaxID=9874 RepID=A0ABM4I8I8_ODOVR